MSLKRIISSNGSSTLLCSSRFRHVTDITMYMVQNTFLQYFGEPSDFQKILKKTSLLLAVRSWS